MNDTHVLDSTIELVTRAARILREAENMFLDRFNVAALPWRRQRTAYRIFLAEFLLVRTRADVVARIFEDVVTRYPDVRALADTDEEALAMALEPLGLRKRVPILLKAARYLQEHHQGVIPERTDELLAIPGMGAYTATAVAAFAYNSAQVPADVNILRFLARLTGLSMGHPTKGSKELRELLPLLSTDSGGPEPEDLLDFSRLICKSGKPNCQLCPLTNMCTYFKSIEQLTIAP